ncbi:MAG: hypothetical protein EBT93_16920, partial [Alphaproteobacteria bacterium]|nr:hypothetical protein [Alphaproteobacteria bacterium]
GIFGLEPIKLELYSRGKCAKDDVMFYPLVSRLTYGALVLPVRKAYFAMIIMHLVGTRFHEKVIILKNLRNFNVIFNTAFFH